MDKKEWKAGALYIRVSTGKQEELSPDAQKRLLLDYAEKNQIKIANEHIYIENGVSGRKADKRPKFQEMIGAAKSREHPFDVILVWKYSRFARNQEESIVYKSLLSRECGIDVVSISEPLADGPFGTLIERIIEWMDEYYSIRLSGEVRRGMTEKALRGGYQSIAPLGYDYHKGIPVINEKEAATIRLIFDKYTIDGFDYSTITRLLNDTGHRTKKGNPFELRVVKYILENPFYIGKVRWNRAPHSRYGKNPEEEVIIADGRHEPVITLEQFYAAQERIKHEFRPANRRGAGYTKHWLAGLLKCCYCGASLVYYRDKRAKDGTGGNFQCYNYAKGRHSISCAISERKAVFGFLEALDDVIVSNNIHFIFRHPSTTSNNSSDAYQRELEKLDKKEQRIKAAYMEGIDTLNEYKENKSILQRQREELLKKIENQEKKAHGKEKPVLLSKCRDICELLKSDADELTKTNAVRSICEKTVYEKEKGTLEITFYLS